MEVKLHKIQYFIKKSNLFWKRRFSKALTQQFFVMEWLALEKHTQCKALPKNQVHPLSKIIFIFLRSHSIFDCLMSYFIFVCDHEGIIPRCVEWLMKYYLQKKKYAETNNQTSLFTVTASYFEIYNEKVYDLLELKDRDLEIRQDANKNIIISNLTEVLFFFFFFFTKHNFSCESIIGTIFIDFNNNTTQQTDSHHFVCTVCRIVRERLPKSKYRKYKNKLSIKSKSCDCHSKGLRFWYCVRSSFCINYPNWYQVNERHFLNFVLFFTLVNQCNSFVNKKKILPIVYFSVSYI